MEKAAGPAIDAAVDRMRKQLSDNRLQMVQEMYAKATASAPNDPSISMYGCLTQIDASIDSFANALKASVKNDVTAAISLATDVKGGGINFKNGADNSNVATLQEFLSALGPAIGDGVRNATPGISVSLGALNLNQAKQMLIAGQDAALASSVHQNTTVGVGVSVPVLLPPLSPNLPPITA